MPDHLPGPDANLSELQRFACVRLVVADLDGTLFPSELAGTAQRLLRQLDHAGIRFTLATGRTYCGVRDLLSKLQDSSERPLIRRGMPIILYNGSVILEASTTHIMKRAVIDDAILRSTFEIAAQFPCELFSYTCEEDVFQTTEDPCLHEQVLAWTFCNDQRPQPAFDINGLPIQWLSGRSIPSEAHPSAILITSSPQLLGNIASQLSRAGVSVTRSGNIFLEIRPPETNKGTAVAWVARALGLRPDEVLTVGDNDNDIEMLNWAGTSVAVSTASERARSQANFVSQLGPFQGVVEVFRLIHQAHRYFAKPLGQSTYVHEPPK